MKVVLRNALVFSNWIGVLYKSGFGKFDGFGVSGSQDVVGVSAGDKVLFANNSGVECKAPSYSPLTRPPKRECPQIIVEETFPDSCIHVSPSVTKFD